MPPWSLVLRYGLAGAVGIVAGAWLVTSLLGWLG